jgi:predicted DNA-binding protein
VKRTQIYLEEEQDRFLGQRAAETGRTRSDLIREAIDRYAHQPQDSSTQLALFRAAVEATTGIAPYLPAGVEYVRRLREADRTRDEGLERRWRS